MVVFSPFNPEIRQKMFYLNNFSAHIKPKEKAVLKSVSEGH